MKSPPEISYASALEVLRAVAAKRTAPASETVFYTKALGRVVATEVRSEMTVPPYTNSAVDGFAVDSSWTATASKENPLRLKIEQVVIAGDAKSDAGPDIAAWQIMTGAPFPTGLDASVKIEEVEVVDGEVVLTRPLARGENARGAGEDFSPGSVVLSEGDVIEPKHLMALAALGHTQVAVKRKPKIGLIATGRELVAPESDVKPGQIRNCTAPFLVAALEALGAEVEFVGTVGDEPKDFFTKMERLLETKPDVILTTGAVSMGIHDHVRPSLLDLGAHVHFHRVSIRPGKPILFAEFPNGGPVVFGLPGNPVSSVVGTRFFIAPFLREWRGEKREQPFRARLSNVVKKPRDLRCFFKAQVDFSTDVPTVEVLAGQPSFMISPLLKATAWGVLDEGTAEVAAGTPIEVWRE